MQTNFPSLKTLTTQLNLDDETAKKVRAVMRRELDPEEASPSTAEWVRQCYNRPTKHELRMHAINELTECHGVEAIFEGGAMQPVLEYCNAGDCYVATIVYFEGRYRVAAIGDIIERHPSWR